MPQKKRRENICSMVLVCCYRSSCDFFSVVSSTLCEMRDGERFFFVGCFLFSLDNLRFKLMTMAMTTMKVFTSWKINSATKINRGKKKWSIHICVVQLRIYLDTVRTVIWLFFPHEKLVINHAQTMHKKRACLIGK